MAAGRVGGLVSVTVNGERYDAKGSWTWNDGQPKREAVIGAEATHGYKETAQVPYIEGVVTLRGNTNIRELMNATDATVVLELGAGRVFSLNDAWFAGDGNVSTEEGEITVRWEGLTSNLD